MPDRLRYQLRLAECISAVHRRVPPPCQSQGPTSAAQSGRAAWLYSDVTAWRTNRRTTFDFSDMVPSRMMRYSVMRLNPAARATKEMLGARLPIRSSRSEY